MYHLLLHKIKFHLCYTFIGCINLAFKKSPGVYSRCSFIFLPMILLLDYNGCPLKGQKQSGTPRGRPTQHSPARWSVAPGTVTGWTTAAGHSQSMIIKGAACHCLQQPNSSSTKPVLPASPLGTSRHGDVVVPSPGNRASQASLWAGLDQGLRGSLCPWYKSE